MEYIFKKEVAPGIIVHTIGVGQNLMLCYVTLKKGAVLPEHAHPHEQASFVVSGRMKFSLRGQEIDCSCGTGLVFQPNEAHSAVAIEDTVVVDSFTPIRQDYLR